MKNRNHMLIASSNQDFIRKYKSSRSRHLLIRLQRRPELFWWVHQRGLKQVCDWSSLFPRLSAICDAKYVDAQCDVILSGVPNELFEWTKALPHSAPIFAYRS